MFDGIASPDLGVIVGVMNNAIKEMKVKLPADLHERLRQAAERDHRSMHAEIVSYVERGVKQDEAKARRLAAQEGRRSR